MDSNPNSDHLSHVACDPDLNPDSGPGARVNAALDRYVPSNFKGRVSSKIHLLFFVLKMIP